MDFDPKWISHLKTDFSNEKCCLHWAYLLILLFVTFGVHVARNIRNSMAEEEVVRVFGISKEAEILVRESYKSEIMRETSLQLYGRQQVPILDFLDDFKKKKKLESVKKIPFKNKKKKERKKPKKKKKLN